MILRVFLIFYKLLWLLITPLALIYIWHRGRRDARYRSRLSERFGRYDTLPQNPIWIHAVSLGELRSAVPLARELLSSGERIVFTHFTPAGRAEAETVFAPEIAAGTVASVWVPFDMSWCLRRFFRACRPKLGLTMEIEIWPGMVFTAKNAGLPLYMCNAQYPDRSMARDGRGLRIRQRVMTGFAGAFVKSQLQADRFAAIGVPNIQVTGELRFDQPIPPALLDAAERLKPALPTTSVVTFASVVEGEDAGFMACIDRLRTGPDAPLIIYVPRAPERFDETYDMLRNAGYTVRRRSALLNGDLTLQGGWPEDTDILLGDSLGEMYFYLSLAQRVVVGGGFVPNGAHNVIEPLALKKPVVTGPYIHTIEYPFREAEAAGVALCVADASALAHALAGPVWTDPAAIDLFMEAHSGAATRTANAIRAELERS